MSKHDLDWGRITKVLNELQDPERSAIMSAFEMANEMKQGRAYTPEEVITALSSVAAHFVGSAYVYHEVREHIAARFPQVAKALGNYAENRSLLMKGIAGEEN